MYVPWSSQKNELTIHNNTLVDISFFSFFFLNSKFETVEKISKKLQKIE
jgi:hypothetical protein